MGRMLDRRGARHGVRSWGMCSRQGVQLAISAGLVEEGLEQGLATRAGAFNLWHVAAQQWREKQVSQKPILSLSTLRACQLLRTGHK